VAMLAFAWLGCVPARAQATPPDGESVDSVRTSAVAKYDQTAAPAAKAKKKFGPGVTRLGSDRPASLGSGVPSVSALRIFLSLALLAAVMGGAFYLLKKASKKISGHTSDSVLRVVGRAQLDSKSFVAMLRSREQEFLVAVGSNGVTLLGRFAVIDGLEETEFAHVGDETFVPTGDSKTLEPIRDLGKGKAFKDYL